MLNSHYLLEYSSLETFLLVISGGIIVISIEILMGLSYLTILHRIFSPRRKQKTIPMKSSNLIYREDEVLLVLEYVPQGWDTSNITLSEDPSLDILDILSRTPVEELPSSREEILGQIDSERERLREATGGEWNGSKLGIESITLKRTANEEHPTLMVNTFTSDHATKLVIERLVKDNKHPQPPLATNVSELSSYRLHSLGLNATIVTDDNFLILVKRSKKTSSARGGLHISINEGMVATDRDAEGNLSPESGLMRGAREELGIEISTESITFHSAIVDLNRYEFGLLGHIDLHGSGITAKEIFTRRTYALIQDRFENQELISIPWNVEEIIHLLEQPDWIAHGWLNLFYSAYSAFPESRSRLYSLLESSQ